MRAFEEEREKHSRNFRVAIVRDILWMTVMAKKQKQPNPQKKFFGEFVGYIYRDIILKPQITFNNFCLLNY